MRMPISDQIRAGRVLLGLEQQTVASRAGISIATLRRVEAGAAPAGTTQRVADALHRAGVFFIAGGVQLRPEDDGASRSERVAALLARADALRVLDPAFGEDALYGEDGLPR